MVLDDIMDIMIPLHFYPDYEGLCSGSAQMLTASSGFPAFCHTTGRVQAAEGVKEWSG